MANELTVTAGLRFARGSGDAAVSLSETLSDTVDVSASQKLINVQTVGTTAEAMTAGDIATQGYVMLRNLDTTNYVTVSTDSSAHANPCIRLKAGEVALFRAEGALYLKANTAACAVACYVLPN